MRSVFNIFFKARGTASWRVLGCLILASLSEGVGIASLLPFLSLATKEGPDQTSPMTEMFTWALQTVGLEPSIGVLLALIAIGLSLKSALLFLAMTYVGYAVSEVATGLRERLMSQLLRVRWLYFTRQPLGHIANAMSNDATRAGQGYLNAARSIAYGIQVIVYCLVAILVSWKLALIALLAGAAITGSLHFLVRRMRRAGQKQTVKTQELVTYLADALGNIKPLKAMDRQETFALLFQRRVDQLRRALRSQFVSRFALENGQDFLAVVLISIGFYVAATYFGVALSELVVVGVLLFQIVSAIGNAQRDLQKAVQFESPYWNLENLIAAAAEAREDRHGDRPANFDKEIVFDRVSFAYGEDNILDGAELVVPKGGITLLTGPSGAGKTTVIDLVLRLIAPTGGSIRIDGVPLAEIDVKAWRHKVGYVPQELVLFHDTIRANVTLGDPTIDDESVMESLRAAGAWDFVSSLADGIETMAGEKGSMLSGGQRQRIALARAIAARPSLLILDEVTSAVDPRTEEDICRRVAALSGETTVLAVSHREAWRNIADRVYEVTGGRVTLKTSGRPAKKLA